MEITYDPIVESRSLPTLRLVSPLRAPEMGRVLVLVPRSGEPQTIHHGGSVPNAWVGVYQYAYLVDVTEHRLNLHVPLLSKDPSFAFRGLVGLVARVNDPVEVVARGIRDVSAALRDHTKWALRQVSRDYDIAQFHEAEYALNAAVRGFSGDAAIRLRNVTVELLVDDDEVVRSGRDYRDVERDTRLSAKRRDRHLEMMRRDGVEGLLAEIVEGEGPRAALEWIAAAEASERQELLSALGKVLEHADPLREPFDLLHAERTVLDRLMDGSAAPFGGTRPGRVRGTRPELGRSSAEREETGGAGESGRRGHRTVRGTVYSEPVGDGPPEDEPEGGVTAPDTDGRSGGTGAGGTGGTAHPSGAETPNGAPRRASRIRGTTPADRTTEEPRP
jgi:hypothetical protein